MFEGDLDHGELEIGQISSMINEVLTVNVIIENMISEYNQTSELMRDKTF